MNTTRPIISLNPNSINFVTKTSTPNKIKRQKISQGYKQMGEDQTEMNEWLSIANNPSNLFFNL